MEFRARWQDPVLELHDSAGVVVNDNWKETQEAVIRDSGVPPTDDRESAIVISLDSAGAYTAIVSGKNDTTGIALVEVFDLGAASLDPSAVNRLANISTRGRVQTGDDVMIGGFIISGQPTQSGGAGDCAKDQRRSDTRRARGYPTGITR